MSFASVTPSVGGVQRVAVYSKAAWANEWIEQTAYEPISVSNVAAPGISQAQIRYSYGNIKREAQTSFANVAPIDLRGWYVKIVVGPAEAEVPIFYGVIPAEQLQTFSGQGEVPAGDYTVTALGLEYLLDGKRIWQSIADLDGGTTTNVINRVIPFNAQASRGLSGFGNRSTAKVEHATIEGVTSYVFSAEGDPWTAQDIAEYILRALPPSDVAFSLDGQVAALASHIPIELDPSGMTPRQLLNAVIDRRRGVSWSVRVATVEGAEVAKIHVSTTVGADVVEGGVTLPANAEISALTLDGAADVDELTIQSETATQYGWVYVEGAPLVSVFTIDHTSGSLAPLWSSAQETAYIAADDEQRGTDGFRGVYRTFQIPRAFTYSAVNPYVDFDGTLTPETNATIRNWGRKLRRELPLAEPWDIDDAFVEFRAPFAVAPSPDTEGKWVYLDRLDTTGRSNVEVRVLDSEAGVELSAPYNHLLGLNHFSGVSEDDAQVDWEAVRVTVAMETDTHLRYVAQISGSTEPDRVLLIRVPDAQLWWIADGTVTDVAADGTLVEQDGDAVLRSDLDRLKGIAALAKAWYGQQRSSLRLGLRKLDASYKVGQFISTATTGGIAEAVQSVVTSVSFDLREHTTQVGTGYEELDIGALA